MATPADLRVVKAHISAVADTIKNFGRPYAEAPDEFHHDLAAAVLTATDGKTRYVIGARDPNGNTYIFGPYATYTTAQNVVAVGLPEMPEGTRAGIYPLIPAPKAPRKKKEK